jgi:two-component system phosphate regulon sensor histidine kinase PhoR
VTLALVPEAGSVVVKVADTGCGIPEEELERIFERFYRLEKSRQTEKGNAGLGLAIVNRIIELHQSKISVESEIDVGTTFLFQLPAYQAQAQV